MSAAALDLGRVVLHAGILVIEAGTLIWMANYLARLIVANAISLTEADAARGKIVEAKEAQETGNSTASSGGNTTKKCSISPHGLRRMLGAAPTA